LLEPGAAEYDLMKSTQNEVYNGS